VNVKITLGNLTDKNIQSCYDILVEFYKKELEKENKKDE